MVIIYVVCVSVDNSSCPPHSSILCKTSLCQAALTSAAITFRKFTFAVLRESLWNRGELALSNLSRGIERLVNSFQKRTWCKDNARYYKIDEGLRGKLAAARFGLMNMWERTPQPKVKRLFCNILDAWFILNLISSDIVWRSSLLLHAAFVCRNVFWIRYNRLLYFWCYRKYGMW